MTGRCPQNGLLLEDLKHFGESLWRNDEIGEKRFNFFLTLVTATIAGLVAVHGSKEGALKLDVPQVSLITRAALWSLFGIGILTYGRLLQKNRVTNEYICTLKYIRNKLIEHYPDLKGYSVPRIPESGNWEWFWDLQKGGLAGTLGALNAALLGAALTYQEITIVYSVFAGLSFFVLSWGGQSW